VRRNSFSKGRFSVIFLKCYKTLAFYYEKRTCPIPWISCLPPGCGPRGLDFDKHSFTFAPKKIDPRKTHIKITFYVENRFFSKKTEQTVREWE